MFQVFPVWFPVCSQVHRQSFHRVPCVLSSAARAMSIVSCIPSLHRGNAGNSGNWRASEGLARPSAVEQTWNDREQVSVEWQSILLKGVNTACRSRAANLSNKPCRSGSPTPYENSLNWPGGSSPTVVAKRSQYPTSPSSSWNRRGRIASISDWKPPNCSNRRRLHSCTSEGNGSSSRPCPGPSGCSSHNTCRSPAKRDREHEVPQPGLFHRGSRSTARGAHPPDRPRW